MYYAHSGKWNKLLVDNSLNTVTNYVDSLKTVAYSGDFNDLTNRPSIPTDLTDLSNIQDGSAGQVLTTDGTGQYTFRDVTASTIEFVNVTNRPTTIAGYGIQDAFSGDYNDLENKPVIFSGSYADLTNKPTIPEDLTDLTDTTNLLFDGVYSSLTGKPAIPSDISNLTDTTNLLFSGSYADLTNKPTSFSSLTALSMNLGVNVDEFSNDATLGDASQTSLITEYAAKSYIDTKVLNAGIGLDDLGVIVNSVGTANLSYDNTTGIFTYTPPDLSSYLTSVAFSDLTSKPTTLAGYGITDAATSAQGTLADTSLQPADVGSFTFTGSTLDTNDSSTITVTPAVTLNSDLTVENDITVNNNLTVTGTLNVNKFVATGVGDYQISSGSTLTLSGTERVEVTNAPFKLPLFTNSQRDALTAEDGDMIYNTDNTRFEAFINGSWVIIDHSPIV